MTYNYEDLELIERHVAQGVRNVLQQRAIVTELSQGGYPTGEALETLATLERALCSLRAREGRIRAEIARQKLAQESRV